MKCLAFILEYEITARLGRVKNAVNGWKTGRKTKGGGGGEGGKKLLSPRPLQHVQTPFLLEIQDGGQTYEYRTRSSKVPALQASVYHAQVTLQLLEGQPVLYVDKPLICKSCLMFRFAQNMGGTWYIFCNLVFCRSELVFFSDLIILG